MVDARENVVQVTGWAWPLALAVATVLGSLAAACMMPFVALSVLCAATMPARRAALTIGAIWAVNQTLGFTVLGYPATVYAAVWGAAIGISSLLAGFIARAILKDRRDFAAVPMLLAFGAAFVAYEAMLFAFALVAGGTETFTPGIVVQLLVNDGLWFVGLSALYLSLARLAPRWFGAVPTLRFA